MLRILVGICLVDRLKTASVDEQCRSLGLSSDLCLERAYSEDYQSDGPDVSFGSDYYQYSYAEGYAARFPDAYTHRHPRYGAEPCDQTAGAACNSATCTRYTNPLDGAASYFAYAEDTPASCVYYATVPSGVQALTEALGASSQMVRRSSGSSS